MAIPLTIITGLDPVDDRTPRQAGVNSDGEILTISSTAAVGTAAETSPSVGATSTSILAANANRKGALITNPAAGQIVYVSFTGTATTADHELAPGGKITLGAVTTDISGIVAAGSQTLKVTEFT